MQNLIQYPPIPRVPKIKHQHCFDWHTHREALNFRPKQKKTPHNSYKISFPQVSFEESAEKYSSVGGVGEFVCNGMERKLHNNRWLQLPKH